MANEFKLILSANIDTSQIQKQLQEISKNFTFNLNSPTANGGSTASLNKAMTDIQRIGAENLKWENQRVSLIVKAEEENSKFDAQQLADIQKIGAENLKWEQQRQAEFAKYQSQVNQFLAKSQNMDTANPKVQNAIGVANNLNGAIASGDIAATRQLSDEFNTAKASLVGLEKAGQSWTTGMISSIKTTIQYAASVGLLYGAFNQLKDGIQYIIDLNKEMTNIQVLQVEGAQTPEQINKLATSYNNLAQELGITTKEVASGSTEWLKISRSFKTPLIAGNSLRYLNYNII